MAAHGIWRLTEAEAGSAGDLLGRAFLDEPVFIAAVPDRAQRVRLCPPLFAANVRHACRCGEALAIGRKSGEPLGIAYWTPKPEPTMPPEATADNGYGALIAEWGPALEQMGALEAQAVRTLESIPQPWRYLAAIGIDPGHQGFGLGSALLRQVLADATAAHVAVGLMTDRAENLPFYRWAGFDLVAEGTTPDGLLRWWSMRTFGE